MAKNINVNLQFTADTSAAKAQMQQLQQQLNNLANSAHLGQGLNTELTEAKQNILGLKVALENATNVDTGKLNFNKFTNELKKGKITVDGLATTFKAMGNEGAEAFLQLGSQIAQSETKIFSLSEQMKKLGITMANTIRWQITSSITTGLMSAFQSTIDYAERLNGTLTDIQIVTGKNVDTMSDFAVQAQKAAKNLSSSTLDYTKASLIYFQQGLNDSEVKERTDTTVKLANVVGENADTVSEWMTSIWNNFDDGSKSLEYYADVLTKLGATTASSADEIAGGLEKFSAVANTVGLSYEYAAAAVTTITAETRQSEEIVGTALKTIFARMEDLDLGKTLDDGTTLGQYSAALATAGVKVKDVNGNLREMDDILDDIMARWGGLSQAQKVSLAQSVAGVRQYSQFMALVDNSDAFKQNVEYAKDSTGELEKQNLIYEKSVAGAKARVENDLEAIKNSFLDENALIPILNGVDDLLVYVDKLIDSLGGLPNILTTVVALAMKLYGPQALASIQQITSSLGLIFKKSAGIDVVGQQKSKMVSQMSSAAAGIVGEGEFSKNYGVVQGSRFSRNEFMIQNEERLTAFYKQTLSLSDQLLQKQEEEVLNESKKVDLLQKELEKKRQILQEESGNTRAWSSFNKHLTEGTLNTLYDGDNKVIDESSINDFDSKRVRKDTKAVVGRFSKPAGDIAFANQREKSPALQYAPEQASKLKALYEDLVSAEEALEKDVKKTGSATKGSINNLNKAKKAFTGYCQEINKTNTNLNVLKKKYPQLANLMDDVIDAQEKYGKGSEQLKEKQEKLTKALKEYDEEEKNALRNSASLSQGFLDLTTGAAMMASGIIALGNAFKSLGESIATGELGFSGVISFLTSTLFAIPMVISGLDSLAKGFQTIKNLSGGLAEAEERKNKLGLVGIAISRLQEEAAKKRAKKERSANQEEQTANKGTILTKLGKLVAEGPTGWAIAAVAIPILAVLGIGTGIAIGSGISAKKEEQEENRKELVQENYTKTTEKVEKNKEVTTNFKSAYIAYKQTGEETDALTSATEELTKVYDNLDSSLIKLSKDYDKILKQTKEQESADLKAAIAATELARIDNEKDYLKKGKEGSGHTAGAQSHNDRDFSSAWTAELNNGTSGKNKANTQIYEALNSDSVKKLLENNPGIAVFEEGGDIRVELEEYDAEHLSAAYETLNELIQVASENGQEKTKLYTNIQTKLAELREFYDKDTEHAAEIREDTIRLAINEASVNLEEINTAQDYENFLKELSSVINLQDEKIKKAFNTIVSEYSNVADYQVRLDAAAEQGQTMGLSKEDQEKLKSLYLNSDKATASAMASVEAKAGMNITELFKEAKKNYDEAYENIAKGLTEDAGKTNKDLETYSKILGDNNKKLKEHADLLYLVSGESIRANKALETLTKAFESNVDTLMTGNIKTPEYGYAVQSISKDLASFLGTSQDLTTYVRQNKQDVAAFLQGDYSLFDKIQIGAAQTLAQTKGVGTELNDIISTIGNLKAADVLSSSSETIENLNDWLKQTGWTVQMVEQVLSPLGIELSYANNQVLGIKKKIDETYLSKDLEEDAKKKKKQLDDELTRYHEIEEVLSDIERELDDISKAKERAFGKSKLALIDQELQKQKELIEVQKRYQAEAQKYYNEDRNTLLSNYAVKLDDTGRITNYTQLEKQYVDAAKSGGDPAKERLDNFKDAVEKYEDSLNNLEEKQQAVIDGQYELQDLALEKIQYTVEFKTEGLDDVLKEIEFLMQEVENDAFAAAATISLIGRQTAVSVSEAKILIEGIANLEGKINGQGFANADDVSQLRDYRDRLVDINAELKEMRQTVQDELTEAFEAWNEKIDVNNAKLDFYGQVVEGYQSIVEAVGKDNLGVSNAFLEDLQGARKRNADNRLASQREQLEAEKALLAQYEQNRASAVDDDSRKEWDEQIAQVQERIQETTTNWQEALQNSLSIAVDSFSTTVNSIADAFSESTGGVLGNIEQMRNAFDRVSEVSDRYLTSFGETYEINKLTRQVQKSIDGTENKQAKKELLNFQKEVQDLAKEDGKISKMDLERAQKKYDLLVAEQELRDRQNAKSVVKLKRDSAGNFGYVYTANSQAVSEAEQKRDDALYNYQKLIYDQDQALTEYFIKSQETMQAEIQQAAEKYGYGTDLFNAEIDKIEQRYSEDMRYIVNEYQKMTDDNVRINEQFNAGVAASYDQTMLGSIYPTYESFEGLYNNTTDNIETATNDLKNAFTNFSNEVKISVDNAGIDIDSFEEKATEELGKIEDASETAKNEAINLIKQFKDEMPKAAEKVTNFQKTYSTAMSDILTKTNNVLKKVNDLITAFGTLSNTEVKTPSFSASGSSSGTSSESADVPATTNEGHWTEVGGAKTSYNKYTGNEESVYTVKNTETGAQKTIKANEDIWNNEGWIDLDKAKEISSSSIAPVEPLFNINDSIPYVKGQLKYGTKKNDDAHFSSNKSETADEIGGSWSRTGDASVKARRYDDKIGSWFYAIEDSKGKGGWVMEAPSYWNKKVFDKIKLTSGNNNLNPANWYSANITDIKTANDYIQKLQDGQIKEAGAWAKKLTKFDTGGYTGDWGPEGKWALLHQKEIVLNADDTKNLLSTIEALRDTEKYLYFSKIAAPQLKQQSSQELLEQNVHITAEFPNVTKSNEIEEAFNNIINMTSQYLGRK